MAKGNGTDPDVKRAISEHKAAQSKMNRVASDLVRGKMEIPHHQVEAVRLEKYYEGIDDSNKGIFNDLTDGQVAKLGDSFYEDEAVLRTQYGFRNFHISSNVKELGLSGEHGRY